MKLSCEDVRDLVPDLLTGRVSTAVAVIAQHHIARCGECAAELEVAREVSRWRMPAPAGLHDRVVAEVVRQRPVRAMRTQLAIAATIALVLIGGRQLAILQKTRVDPAAPSVQAPTVENRGPGWMTVENALNTGAASLGDLSEEQLRQLLTELES